MRITLIPLLVLTAGCAQIPDLRPMPTATPSSIETAPDIALPDEDAITVEDFDTTTTEQREEALAAPSSSGNSLGTTVASLGDAATPGFWLETPLVSAPTTGRVRNPDTGRTVQVDLRPSPGGSSRISLAALRLLEAPLTELVTLEVFLNT
ncbi:MAG: hypothetical protein ACU0GG_10730 [Paracoccaceae bacterium]